MARTGRPTKKAGDLIAARRPGMRRFTVEIDEETLTQVDAEAAANARRRNGEVRVLITEALAGREKRRRR